MPDKNILITTLVYTENFLPLAEVLGHSITKRFKSKYQFKVLVTQNVNINNYPLSVDYEVIPYIEFTKVPQYKNSASRPQNYYKGTLNKFWVLTLEQYDYIIFIDTDMFIKGNIDEDIDKLIDGYSNIPAICQIRRSQNIPTGEFFIVKPNRSLWFDIMDKCKDTCLNDEEVLNIYFKQYCNDKLTDEIKEFYNRCLAHDSFNNKLLVLFPQTAKVMVELDNARYLKVVEAWYEQKREMIELSWG